jgi:hypothetical protein
VCTVLGSGKVRYISIAQLLLDCWAQPFGQQFAISQATVIAALAADDLSGWAVTPTGVDSLDEVPSPKLKLPFTPRKPQK